MSLETHTSTLSVLIVYDSLRAGKGAKELCDRLGQQLAPDCKLDLSVWSLSALQLLPNMARAAAREAEHAAMLIVAVNGVRTLPRTAKSCLDWCARGIRSAGGALMAQLHGILKMDEDRCPAYGSLRAMARHVGLRFFPEVVELPDNEPNSCGSEPISTGGVSGRLTPTPHGNRPAGQRGRLPHPHTPRGPINR
jgi:hypothetical protein